MGHILGWGCWCVARRGRCFLRGWFLRAESFVGVGISGFRDVLGSARSVDALQEGRFRVFRRTNVLFF